MIKWFLSEPPGGFWRDGWWYCSRLSAVVALGWSVLVVVPSLVNKVGAMIKKAGEPTKPDNAAKVINTLGGGGESASVTLTIRDLPLVTHTLDFAGKDVLISDDWQAVRKGEND